MGDVTVLVSPAEPPALRRLGSVSMVTEEYGADFLIVGPAGMVGVQRKKFPSDFVGSLSDGRLHTVVMKIRATTLPIIVLEGDPTWSLDGALLNQRGGPNLQRSTLRAMEWSLMQSGIGVQWTDDLADTADYIGTLAEWWAKDTHNGFGTRPGPGRANEFGVPTSDRDWALHVLQGFDGVGPGLAQHIYDEFERLPLRWDVTEAELRTVHGLGPKRLASLGKRLPFKKEDE